MNNLSFYNNNPNDLQLLEDYLNSNSIHYEKDVELKKKTWIHRGGKCAIFITPTDSDTLLQVSQYLYANNIGFLVVGHTSNIYITNESNIDVVLNTVRCNKFENLDNTIVCECGASVSNMAKEMTKKGVAGFEHLHELPGTVAGAIHNNSSCLSNSISSLLVSATIVKEDGTVSEMSYDDFHFRYRTSIMKDKTLKGVIIKAKLKVTQGNADELEQIAAKTNARRKVNLEGNAKNLGCTVNRTFCNGRMPLQYLIPSRIHDFCIKFKEKDALIRKKKHKDFLCKIAGYSHISKYISNKSMITFMWIDEGADSAFPDYLEFMKKVFKTDHVEIEVIRN